jgi:HTH-type transcriptional regulator/antitoxin HigA
MSAALAVNPRKYRLLLDRTMPVAIQTDTEHQRMLRTAARLMEKGEDLTTEEGRVLKLLAILIQDYERQRYALPRVEPRKMLQDLLEERGLKPSSLWPVVGSKARVSEILSGKRAVSKLQAKRLADFFGVSAGLFL